MCDTSIYLLQDDGSELVHLHSLSNWAPVADAQVLGDLLGRKDEEDVVNQSVDELAAALPSEGRDRLYVAAGHRMEGAIKELRMGLKTNVLVEFELEQLNISSSEVDSSVQKIRNLTVPKDSGEDASEGYLVLNMTHNETKVLRWSSSTPQINRVPWAGVLDMSIDDCTQQLSPSYHFSESTLAVALTDRGLLQITPSGIYLSEHIAHTLNPDERIVQAAIVSPDHIAVVVYFQSQYHWALMTYTLSSAADSSLLLSSDPVILPREPTTIKSIVHRSTPTEALEPIFKTFLAYRQPPEIQIYSSSSTAAQRDPINPTLIFTLPLIDIPGERIAAEIHSIEILCTRSEIGHLIIGTRHGLVVAYRMLWSGSHRVDFPERSMMMTLGDAPVEFIPLQQLGASSVFAMTGFLWEIAVETECPEGVKVREVLFDDFRIVLFPVSPILFFWFEGRLTFLATGAFGEYRGKGPGGCVVDGWGCQGCSCG